MHAGVYGRGCVVVATDTVFEKLITALLIDLKFLSLYCSLFY